METKIKLKQLLKFRKAWQKRKANRIVALMNEVINSPEFEQKILAFNFSDTRYRIDSKEDYREVESNAEVLEILRKGKEQDSMEEGDYTWELRIQLGRFLSQVGRREGRLIITQNWFFKKSGNEKAVAGHWFHEYSHVLGFHHDYERTERRPNSVPYALNQIVEEILQ